MTKYESSAPSICQPAPVGGLTGVLRPRGETAFVRLEPLDHDLAKHYPALRAVANREELLRSAVWALTCSEVERVLDGIECGAWPASMMGARRSLRVVAWNINRGAHLASLAHFLSADPVLAESDVLLLSEVDSGCARSGNRNVARELAAALGMSYAFAPSYLTLADDIGENAGREENTLALAGVAILSRVPMLHAANVDLPELRDKFSSSERRLGRKRALLVDLALQGGPVRVCVCHLDSQASPSQRALQLAALLSRAGDDFPTLIGGDFNTSTCDLSSPGAIVRDVLRKLFVVGADAAVAAFMTPEQGGEEPIFELLARERFAVDALNVRNAPTFAFDLNDPYTIAKTLREAGNVVLWTLRHALRRWNMRVPSRLDWFAGRGVRALDARVIVAPRLPSGIPVTDHAAIVCDVELLARGARDPLAPPP